MTFDSKLFCEAPLECQEREEMFLVETIAGGSGGHKDDIGKEAEFNRPYGIVISNGKKDLFVLDCENFCARRISLVDGTTSTIAGIPGMEL